HCGLEHIGLKPLIEKIDGAHSHQLNLVVLVFAAETGEAAAEEEQLKQIARVQRGRIGRHHAQDWLDESAHLQHRLAKFLVGLGIEPRMASYLPHGLAVIVHAPQVVAIRHGREGAVQRENLEAVPGKIEIADDFRPQQRYHITADRELEAGNDLFCYRSAAQHMTALQHQHPLACARKIGGVNQSVVPTADYDGVILTRTIGNHDGLCGRRNSKAWGEICLHVQLLFAFRSSQAAFRNSPQKTADLRSSALLNVCCKFPCDFEAYNRQFHERCLASLAECCRRE